MKTISQVFKSRKNVILLMGLFIGSVTLTFFGCSKEANTLIPESENASLNKSMPASFVIKNGSSDQSFNVSCTCAGGFTLTSNPSALYYGTTTSTTVPVSNSNYSVTFQKNQYYYIVPIGGSYGNNTKCLKIKFITGNNKPACDYNSSTNTWSGLGTNSDVDATQINKSSVPACTPC